MRRLSEQDRGSQPKPTKAAAPTFTPMPPLLACGYFAAAVVLAVAQGFGQSVVSTNLQQIQGGFGASQAEASWLVAAYMAPNVSLTLALIKIRNRFGLRNFAELSILAFLAAALLSYEVNDLHTAIAVRFVAGMAAAPMTSLAFLYLLEPLPPHRKMNVGLSLALTVIFMGSSLTRLISPHLLEVDLWRGLMTMQSALAMIGFGLIYLLPLRSPTQPMKIEAADIVSYLLIAVGMGSVAVALIFGPIYWWLEAPWIGALLAVGVAACAAAAMIELNRRNPLLDVRWLASPSVLHFAGALLVFRIVLSEQSSGAPGLFRALGLTNDQTQGLYGVIIAATIACGIFCAVTLKPGRERAFHIVALLLLIAGASMDAHATSQTLPQEMYLSQGMIAMASALFLPPALLSGLMTALAKGADYILSFIIVFLTTQKVGGLLGSAVFNSVITVRQQFHLERLSETLRAADPMVQQRLQQLSGAYGDATTDAAARVAQGAALLKNQLSVEATVLAYNDAFHLIALTSAGALAALLCHAAIDALRNARTAPLRQKA